MSRREQSLILLMSFVAFLVLNIQSVNAKDELYLTGVVRTVYANSGLVLVDVKSKSCPGVRRFKFDNTLDMEGLEGKKISFSIDSSVCKAGVIYKIIAMTVVPEVNSK
jgi:hypothetical protein